jgi:S-phase kinase-associated protein 1
MILESNDGIKFNVRRDPMLVSNLINTIVDSMDSTQDVEIPLPNVTGGTLSRIIEFCEYYDETPMKQIPRPLPTLGTFEDVVNEWYNQFISSFCTKEALFELIQAAHYMDIPPLLELGCAKIASMIRGKNITEIKTILDL